MAEFLIGGFNFETPLVFFLLGNYNKQTGRAGTKLSNITNTSKGSITNHNVSQPKNYEAAAFVVDIVPEGAFQPSISPRRFSNRRDPADRISFFRAR
jgi:hypothetical protein